MNTINVIEISDTLMPSIAQLVAFPDNELGNTKAEKLFGDLIAENNGVDGPVPLDPESLQEAIENGYWEDHNGYCIGLVHSAPKLLTPYEKAHTWSELDKAIEEVKAIQNAKNK